MSNTAQQNDKQNENQNENQNDEVEVKPPEGKPSQAEGDAGDSDQG